MRCLAIPVFLYLPPFYFLFLLPCLIYSFFLPMFMPFSLFHLHSFLSAFSPTHFLWLSQTRAHYLFVLYISSTFLLSLAMSFNLFFPPMCLLFPTKFHLFEWVHQYYNQRISNNLGKMNNSCGFSLYGISLFAPFKETSWDQKIRWKSINLCMYLYIH